MSSAPDLLDEDHEIASPGLGEGDLLQPHAGMEGAVEDGDRRGIEIEDSIGDVDDHDSVGKAVENAIEIETRHLEIARLAFDEVALLLETRRKERRETTQQTGLEGEQNPAEEDRAHLVHLQRGKERQGSRLGGGDHPQQGKGQEDRDQSTDPSEQESGQRGDQDEQEPEIGRDTAIGHEQSRHQDMLGDKQDREGRTHPDRRDAPRSANLVRQGIVESFPCVQTMPARKQEVREPVEPHSTPQEQRNGNSADPDQKSQGDQETGEDHPSLPDGEMP